MSQPAQASSGNGATGAIISFFVSILGYLNNSRATAVVSSLATYLEEIVKKLPVIGGYLSLVPQNGLHFGLSWMIVFIGIMIVFWMFKKFWIGIIAGITIAAIYWGYITIPSF